MAILVEAAPSAAVAPLFAPAVFPLIASFVVSVVCPTIASFSVPAVSPVVPLPPQQLLSLGFIWPAPDPGLDPPSAVAESEQAVCLA